MAQAIANTEWSAELVREGSKLAPDEFDGDPAVVRVWTGSVQADGTGWADWTFHPKT